MSDKITTRYMKHTIGGNDVENKHLLIPKMALKKLKLAKSMNQTVYIYGATSYGKTELVRDFLNKKKYTYFTCLTGLLQQENKNMYPIVVIDDIQFLKQEDNCKRVIALVESPKCWVILISRSKVPSWLMTTYLDQMFVIVDEQNLCIQQSEILAYAKMKELSFTQLELQRIMELTKGSPIAIRFLVDKISEYRGFDDALIEEYRETFIRYIENTVLLQWDCELTEFLLEISIVDEFSVPLAEMITGSVRVIALIEQAESIGNFIIRENELYRIRPMLLYTLQHKAKQMFDKVKLENLTYNAGLYYELQDDIPKALSMYEQGHHSNRIRELLIRNARRNPGNGHYYGLRKYYLELEHENIEDSIVLMAGMSMVYSLLLQPKLSEEWYEKLKRYKDQVKGVNRRELRGRIAYLDIALPHRGTKGLIKALKNVSLLLLQGNIELSEVSVTSNMPSIMNGGKDFCEWSKKDKELSVLLGKTIECVLGRYGKGLISIAMGESQFEKGGDTYDILSLLSRGQLQTEAGGMLETAFASVGLQIRLNLLYGNEENAHVILKSFEKKVKEQKATQLLPNLKALSCRVDLYKGNREEVERWMMEAPDEDKEFFIMERYRYLTKVRCYLMIGDLLKSMALLEKLILYAEHYHRTYVWIESKILLAITQYRLGEGDWKDTLLQAIKRAQQFHFIRVVSEEGAAVMELLKLVRTEWKDEVQPAYLNAIYKEGDRMSTRYPLYLKRQLRGQLDFSKNALAILRLQAEGLTYGEIAQKLGIKEETVRYHCKNNYRKLDVTGKADAVIVARELKLI